MTYRFRINPNARFSDGTPVTSDDVVATWDLMVDKTLQDPAPGVDLRQVQAAGGGEQVHRARSSQGVELEKFSLFQRRNADSAGACSEDAERRRIFEAVQFQASSGFGSLHDSRKRHPKRPARSPCGGVNDYWAIKDRANVGLNNFDQLQFTVVRDDNLAFEMFKKGELDVYVVSRARQWVEEMNFDNVQRGVMQKRKVFNSNPQGSRDSASIRASRPSTISAFARP